MCQTLFNGLCLNLFSPHGSLRKYKDPVCLILQMKTLRHSCQSLAWGDLANKWRGRNSDPASVAPEPQL